MVSHGAVAFYLLVEEISRLHELVQSGQGPTIGKSVIARTSIGSEPTGGEAPEHPHGIS
jgi:hypothetical protein